MVVHKLTLPQRSGEHQLIVPKDARIVSCQLQSAEPTRPWSPSFLVITIWFLTNENETEKRSQDFLVVMTGEEFLWPFGMKHLATLQYPDGIVAHVFTK
jgi:hypothetical protein